MQPISYARHQFPPEIIRHATWLYLRFTLSYRDAEELLAERELDVSYETLRRWVLKLGPAVARNLRRLRPRPADTWHLDEMVVRIGGKQMYLWRAVDSEGEILDLLVQPRRDKCSAMKLMRKLLKTQGYAPTVLVTDKLASYGCARRELGLPVRHEQAPGGTTTRAKDAGVQVCWLRPALSLHPLRRPQQVQFPTSSRLPSHAAPVQNRCGGAMEARSHSCMRDTASSPIASPP
jgi:transposase-like protein